VSAEEHQFPFVLEDFLSTLAQICATSGATREVAVLAVAKGALELWESDPGFRQWGYRLALRLPTEAFVYIGDRREAVERSLCSTANEVLRLGGEYITEIVIVPDVVPVDNWRGQAVSWLTGKGINNQGRVRSDNIATRQCDGLLFRSGAEINLYRALKSIGVSFAPLPIFVRGGNDYRRIEPDFVIVAAGVVMVIEVDGDTVHRETPAEAHDRTAMLVHEGVHVERVRASECDDQGGAQECATRLLEALRKIKVSRT
jgi:hypothetical protein